MLYRHMALSAALAALLAVAAMPARSHAQPGADGDAGAQPYEKRIGGFDADREIDRLLHSESASMRGGAAIALGIMRDARAVGPLIDALDDEDGPVRMNAAWALCAIGATSCEERFMDALEEGDLPVIAGAYRFYIRRGEPGAEKPLVEALQRFGTKKMACDFIHCGNPALVDAGKDWAESSGLDTAKLTDTGRGPRWGADN